MDKFLRVFPEPELEFRFGQRVQHPQDGLALFGPYDSDQPSHPSNITYGVIGSPEGISLFERWSRVFSDPIINNNLDANLWPSFPGFEAVTNSKWPISPAWTYDINRSSIISASKENDPYKRAHTVANYLVEGFKIAAKRDENFGVFLCIIPDEVWQNCRPQSIVMQGRGPKLSWSDRRQRIGGQIDLFDQFDPETYRYSVDFRRQLKARAMEFGVPIQIILESTLSVGRSEDEHSRRLTPLSDRAWNLTTTLYYKAGGKPWRLSTARKGVCYIGIAFRKENADLFNSTACCAAQMFLDSGDGLVFLGEYGPWFSPRYGDFHLTSEAAFRLLEGVLKTYKEMYGEPLTEIFLHSRSSINDAEFQGYRNACPPGVKLVGVRVQLDRFGLRLYRPGTRPVIRGTFLRLSDTTGYLWASGFKPRLRTYDGWEVPVPLRIDVQHGAADIEEVAKDIFGLTKLNYNSSRMGDSQPVTVLFSNAVGEILISNPGTPKRLPSFKFYI